MATNTTPNLTNIVEQKFLSLIEDEELTAFESNSILSADSYLKLANLYHFQKDFGKEEEILTRFTDSEFADGKDMIDILERIGNISEKRHILQKAPQNTIVKNSELSLAAIESEKDIVELKSNKTVTHKNKNTQTAINGLTITVLTVCAVYTGKKIEDEIAQLSLVLLEYTENKNDPFRIIQTYRGNRKTSKLLTNKIISKFNIAAEAIEKLPMDKEVILKMFSQANYVVSHNNADIERQHLVTLFPVLKSCKWYSTQKDIPWKALGFESTSLSVIIKSFGRRKPRTSLERAKAICQILQHKESSTNNPLIERIHYMKPMKAINWTTELQQQHTRLSKTQTNSPSYFVWLLVLVVAGFGVTKYLNYW